MPSWHVAPRCVAALEERWCAMSPARTAVSLGHTGPLPSRRQPNPRAVPECGRRLGRNRPRAGTGLVGHGAQRRYRHRRVTPPGSGEDHRSSSSAHPVGAQLKHLSSANRAPYGVPALASTVDNACTVSGHLPVHRAGSARKADRGVLWGLDQCWTVPPHVTNLATGRSG